jgi:hypothetical protein
LGGCDLLQECGNVVNLLWRFEPVPFQFRTRVLLPLSLKSHVGEHSMSLPPELDTDECIVAAMAKKDRSGKSWE